MKLFSYLREEMKKRSEKQFKHVEHSVAVFFSRLNIRCAFFSSFFLDIQFDSNTFLPMLGIIRRYAFIKIAQHMRERKKNIIPIINYMRTYSKGTFLLAVCTKCWFRKINYFLRMRFPTVLIQSFSV